MGKIDDQAPLGTVPTLPTHSDISPIKQPTLFGKPFKKAGGTPKKIEATSASGRGRVLFCKNAFCFLQKKKGGGGSGLAGPDPGCPGQASPLESRQTSNLDPQTGTILNSTNRRL